MTRFLGAPIRQNCQTGMSGSATGFVGSARGSQGQLGALENQPWVMEGYGCHLEDSKCWPGGRGVIGSAWGSFGNWSTSL